MRWLVIVVASFIFLIAIIYVVGALLPVKHTAEVHEKFPISSQQLWHILSNYKEYPQWRSAVKSVVVAGDNKWTELNKYGDEVSYRAEDVKENERFISRITNQDLPYGGYWEFTITPHETGCELKIKEFGKVYNPLFRFMSKFIFGHETTLREYFNDLNTEIKARANSEHLD